MRKYTSRPLRCCKATKAIFRHSSPWLDLLWSWCLPSPVNSLMLSTDALLGLPLFLFPGTVPCNIVFACPLLLVTCPNHFNYLFLNVPKCSSYGTDVPQSKYESSDLEPRRALYFNVHIHNVLNLTFCSYGQNARLKRN